MEGLVPGAWLLLLLSSSQLPYEDRMNILLLEMRKVGFGYSRTQERIKKAVSLAELMAGRFTCVLMSIKLPRRGLLVALIKYTTKWDLIFLPL